MTGIPVVYDSLAKKNIESFSLLPADPNELSQLRIRIRSERKLKNVRYTCGFCRDPIYQSNSGTPHFSHYSDSDPECPWRTFSPQRLRDISARRFQGRQVSELHIKLILSIEELLRRNSNFSEVGSPDQTFFHRDGKGHRFPDLQAKYLDHRIVLELQLSSTYLPVVTDREEFYRENEAFLFWVFHGFKEKANRQTEKDVAAIRSRQVFEIDAETIRESLDSSDLLLRCHWQEPLIGDRASSWQWQSRIVSMSQLSFDRYLMEAKFADPWKIEAEQRHKYLLPQIRKFEEYWIARLNERGSENPIQIMENELSAFSDATGLGSIDLSSFDRLRFEPVLDRFIFFRDEVNHANGQPMIGAAHTILDQYPHFTDAMAAILFAYGRTDVYSKHGFVKKVIAVREIQKTPQCHDYDAHLSIIFPEAAAYLRASCVPFFRSLHRKACS